MARSVDGKNSNSNTCIFELILNCRWLSNSFTNCEPNFYKKKWFFILNEKFFFSYFRNRAHGF